MIQLIDLNKFYEDKHVLQNINANFYSGVANLVIGASGGGKSVLVKTMVGLETPTSGQVLFEEQDYHNLEYDKQQALRREIGKCQPKGTVRNFWRDEKTCRHRKSHRPTYQVFILR